MSLVVLTTAALGSGPQAVSREAHAFYAVDAAFGRFVSVPVLESGSDDRLDTGLASRITTMSTARTSSRSISFGVWSVMSTPTSARA